MFTVIFVAVGLPVIWLAACALLLELLLHTNGQKGMLACIPDVTCVCSMHIFHIFLIVQRYSLVQGA